MLLYVIDFGHNLFRIENWKNVVARAVIVHFFILFDLIQSYLLLF